MNLPLRQYWTLLSAYLAPHRRQVALLAVLLGAHIGVQLFNPQLIRFFIDAAARGAEAAASLTPAAALFIGGALARADDGFTCCQAEDLRHETSRAWRLGGETPAHLAEALMTLCAVQ